MPVMDGVEATHEILNYEAEEKLKHTPIIALTANALKGDKERFIEEGLDDYIPKPIETNELLFILKKFLEQDFSNKEEEESKPKNDENNDKDKNIDKNNKQQGDILETIKPTSIIQSNGITLLLEEEEERGERFILIAKKNPLEAQILSKVLSNLTYKIEILDTVKNLESKVQDINYDLLFIDIEIEVLHQKALSKHHNRMNIIRLSLNDPNDKLPNSYIQEEIIGVMSKDKLMSVIEKYRSR